jgi:hypothetical protein
MSETRKDLAIEALAHGRNVTDASQEANVTARTVHRWLDDDDFRCQVIERKGDVLEQVGRRLASYSLHGLDRLRELSDSDNESISLRASKALVDRFTDILQFIQLEKRLEALENQRMDK